MNTKLYVAKVATTLAVASLAITLATTAAFGRARIPGTTLPAVRYTRAAEVAADRTWGLMILSANPASQGNRIWLNVQTLQ